MTTLNPINVYNNLKTASDIEWYLPRFKEQINKLYSSEETKMKNSLRKLGSLEKDCYCDGGILPKLIKAIEDLDIPSNVKLTHNGKMYILPHIKESTSVNEINSTWNEIVAGSVTGVAAGVTTGGLTALGAWSLISTFGMASTGTAINTLSGAAATQAILAWLGGGAIAAGGTGAVGGMVVLGGLIAVPAILITTISLSAKSEKLYADALSELEKARAEESRIKLVAERMREIGKIGQFLRKTLQKMTDIAQISLEEILLIKENDIDYDDYTEEENIKCYKAYRICKLLCGFCNMLRKENQDISKKERICQNFDNYLAKVFTEVN